MSRTQRSVAVMGGHSRGWYVFARMTILTAVVGVVFFGVFGVCLLLRGMADAGLFALAIAGYCGTLGQQLLEHLASTERRRTASILALLNVLVLFLASGFNVFGKPWQAATFTVIGVTLTLVVAVLNYCSSKKASTRLDTASTTPDPAATVEVLMRERDELLACLHAIQESLGSFDWHQDDLVFVQEIRTQFKSAR